MLVLKIRRCQKGLLQSSDLHEMVTEFHVAASVSDFCLTAVNCACCLRQ